MKYEDALTAAWNGKAVLFLGSGFSTGAESLDGEAFPTGSALAKFLCKRAEIKETTDLRQASSRYIKKLSDESLVDLLTNIFTARSTSTAQKQIVLPPWKGVYTTNYDNILERASADNGKKLRPVELADNPRNYKDNSSCVLHINGFIDSLTTETLASSFKLTSASYLTEKFRESPWSTIFTRQILSAHAVFFVGYSLYDLEIQEILFSDSTLRDKTFFIEYPGLDEEDVELSDLNDFGTLLPIGVEQFAADLIRRQTSGSTESSAFIAPSFHEQLVPELTVPVTHRDDDIFDLLLQGRIEEKFLWADPAAERKSEYLLSRETIGQIGADKKRNSNYIITSDLGNGKTVFSYQIAHHYLKAGYRVFWLRDDAYDCFDDVESICGLNVPCLIIIENYARKLALVEHVTLKRHSNVILVLTERTSVHENTEDALYFSNKIIDVSASTEIDLNKLSEKDVGGLSIYLEKYGLWGERSRMKDGQKLDYIRRSCNAELHGVLLGILQSSQIKQKFTNLFDSCSTDSNITRTLISGFVLKMLGVSEPTPHTISALSDSSAIFDPRFKNNLAVRQLFNNTRGSILPKSSVLAEFFLQSFKDPQLLVSMLVKIAHAARSKAPGSDMYWKLYRDMASFKYIQRMLPEKGKRESLIQFYEGLREVELERENPHFWLQYAIARLTFPDLENLGKARIYLDTALGLAKKRPNYTTTDIETQYARYHLEYANNTDLPHELAFIEFERAHAILDKITSLERHKREPFRPVRLFESFFKKYGNSLKLEQVQFINNVAERMIKHIKLLPYNTSKEQNVIMAATSLRALKILTQQRVNALENHK